MNKKCSKCKELKNENCFFKSADSVTGLQSYCKKCKVEHAKNEKQREWRKIYCRNNEAHKYRHKKLTAKYIKDNPQIIMAQKIANKNKELLKKMKCEICGSNKTLHMHHPNYEKPKNVITLCSICHKQIHQKGKNL